MDPEPLNRTRVRAPETELSRTHLAVRTGLLEDSEEEEEKKKKVSLGPRQAAGSERCLERLLVLHGATGPEWGPRF